MNTELESRARAYLAAHPVYADFRDDFGDLEPALQNAVAALKYAEERKDFEEKFRTTEPGPSTEHLSPSGKYRLTCTPYGSNTLMAVARREGEGWVPVGEILRNYSPWWSFVENHPSGHSFFVSGEDYQRQTVIELDTGARRDSQPSEAAIGWGFCWTGAEFHAGQQVLIVDGCHWACPYEYRVYDFSRPMDGWPLIQTMIDGEWDMVEQDQKLPEIEGAIFRFFETSQKDNQRVVLSTKTFERVDNLLIYKGEEVSEAEAEARRAREEKNRAWQAWLDNFKATDPLFLAAKNLSEDLPRLDRKGRPKARHYGYGVCHDRWCPSYVNLEEKRFTLDILETDELEIEVEWGVDQGPIKLVIGGPRTEHGRAHVGDRFVMEHSEAAMREAMAIVREIASEMTAVTRD